MHAFDDADHRGAPSATLLLIVANTMCFLLELGQPSGGAVETLIRSWGVVPREYTAGRDLAPTIPAPFWATLLTSTFLHAGWGHLGGNMLFLWVFGEDVERRIGGVRFLLCYVACGVAADVTHIVSAPSSTVPTIGASGAVSGVLGAYLVLFPPQQPRVLSRAGLAHAPALLLGLWILAQLVGGLDATGEPGAGGVAYLAHLGGFVAGVLLSVPCAARGSRPPAYC